jgi:hypothetical protein
MNTRIANDNYMTADQRAAVSRVRNASDGYRVARINLERQLREQLQRELSGLMAVRDNEVRIAYALGVRKATLKRAIGSKDHATIQNILSIGGALTMPDSSQVTWIDTNNFVLNYVDYKGERIYGGIECSVVADDQGNFVAWDVALNDGSDPIMALIESTSAAGDLTVYNAVSDVVRR